MSTKRKALLARKEKILEDLKYYEMKLANARSNHGSISSSSGFEDGDSSDSDTDLMLNVMTGPSTAELNRQKNMLKTCLSATEELTQLDILQSKVNVMVQDPVIESASPVKENGVWTEVMVECRVDMVQFSITFFVHKPHRKFAAPSYRCLRVAAVKKNHDAELNRSVLPELERPSDAVELLRNYAVAHRSRRETLKCLAEKFGDSLHMDILPDGGYQLKSDGIFEISWTLLNKWSPVAWFHHRMKFDIESIDESYLKTIKHANNQLPNPSLKTSERTMLLSKIISTCLEARGQVYESMESDAESIKTLEKNRTTLDYEPEDPVNHNKKEIELMAPPKSFPKKTKRKSDVNNDNAKKSRVDNHKVESVTVKNRVDKPKNVEHGNVKGIDKNKDNNTVRSNGEDVMDDNFNKAVNSNKNKVANDGKTVIKDTKAANHKEGLKDKGKKVTNANKKIYDEIENHIAKGDMQKVKGNVAEKLNSKSKNAINVGDKKARNIVKSANTQYSVNNKVKPKNDKPKENAEKVVEKPKTVASVDAENDKNIPNKITNKTSVTGKINSKTNATKKLDEHIKSVNKNDAHETIEKVVEKRQSIKNKDRKSEKTVTERVNDNAKKVANIKNKAAIKNMKNNQVKMKNTIKQIMNVKKTSENQAKTSNNVFVNQQKTANIGDPNKPKTLTDKHRQSIKNIKKNIVNKLPVSKPIVVKAITKMASKQDGGKLSKIPQKMIAAGVVKKNPLRISPRKFPASFKNAVRGTLHNRSAQKIVTNIPRLLKKPNNETKNNIS